MTTSRSIREWAKILDHIHDSVTQHHLDGRVSYWNKRATNLYGWTAHEARDQSIWSLLKAKADIPLDDVMASIRDGGWEGDIEISDRSGGELRVHIRCILLRDDSGRPDGFTIVGNNVTAFRQKDEASRGEARYRALFNSPGMSIWECDFSALRQRLNALARAGVTDFAAHIATEPSFVREAIEMTLAVDANKASMRMFGAHTKTELLGSIGRFWPNESEPIFAASILTALSGRHAFSAEVALQTLTGKPLDVLFSASFPPEAASGKGIFITLADVTTRNTTQAALRSAQSDLAHAARLTALGELTASIAHEVNQPLGGIVANGQAGLRWLRRAAPDLDAAIMSFEAMVLDARRASSVIEKIRALAKKEDMRSEPLDLTQVIEDTLALLAYELSRSEIRISLETLDPELHVRGDRIQIQQVIINLIMNAVQAMAGIDNRVRSIRITSSIEESDAVISVADTGPGVDPAIRDGIFTAFTTSRPDGMGLGLSVCATIIGRHGGKIWTNNGDRGGAIFSFSVPLMFSGDPNPPS